jgi:hypothetical protein
VQYTGVLLWHQIRCSGFEYSGRGGLDGMLYELMAWEDFLLGKRNKKDVQEFGSELMMNLKNLRDQLNLELHPDKISIKTIASGVDYLGWVHFPDHRVLRTVTKRRMFRNIQIKQGKKETIESYLGLLSHGNAKSLKQILTHGKTGVY